MLTLPVKDQGAVLLPLGWAAIPLRYLISEPITDGPHETPDFVNDGIPFLSVDSIQDGDLVFANCRFISPGAHSEYSKKCAPRRDDILLAKAASTGKIARVKVNIIFSIWSPLALIRPAPSVLRPRFLEYALKSVHLQAQVELFCTMNTQRNLSMDEIPRLRIPIPPIDVQDTIADFLDRETAKADALVAKYERLIELIEEKRVALIMQAVTKGLDPKVPMKDSGVEWIGEMPAHWSCPPLRYMLDLRSGGLIPGDLRPERGASDHPVYGSTEMLGFSAHVNVLNKTLTIARVGQYAGKISIIEGPCWVTDNALIASVDQSQLSLEFAVLLLRAMNINNLATRTAQPLITGGIVRAQFVPVPDPKEQAAITSSVLGAESKIDGLVSAADRAMALIREHRSALITAAVTGQIDVRAYEPEQIEVPA